MRRLTSPELSLHLITPWTETSLAQSEILINGQKTGRVITGEVLEAAIEWQSYRLVFATDNIPHEDYLRIYLVDARWQIVDSATLGAMYTTGAFSGLDLRPPNCLHFDFLGGVTWAIELLETPSVSLPFTDPKGVSRPPRLFKRFKIKGRPLPEGRRTDTTRR